jgi:mannose-1-phosphate guanylyltransferase
MDAIVLVGGQGTRLRPLTARRHKSLVPIRNRPQIEHLFEWLEQSGFERAVLAIGRFNDDLADAYRDGRPGRLKVELVEETERLESGGAIRNAVQEAKILGRFAVCNGDVVVDFDFAPFLAEHIAREAELTLALYPVENPSMYGIAAVDDTSMVVGFVEKPPPGTEPSNLVNAGVWIFEPHLVGEIPPGAVRVEETLFPSLVARGRPVLGRGIEGIWADIGTPSRYLEVNQALLERDDGCDVAGAQVAVDARVTRSSLGAGTVVGAGADIAGSITWENVAIHEGAHVYDSIIADSATIGAGARLQTAVIGAGATVPAGSTLPPGTSLGAGETYEGEHD